MQLSRTQPQLQTLNGCIVEALEIIWPTQFSTRFVFWLHGLRQRNQHVNAELASESSTRNAEYKIGESDDSNEAHKGETRESDQRDDERDTPLAEMRSFDTLPAYTHETRDSEIADIADEEDGGDSNEPDYYNPT
jgi:hypothetical protein